MREAVLAYCASTEISFHEAEALQKKWEAWCLVNFFGFVMGPSLPPELPCTWKPWGRCLVFSANPFFQPNQDMSSQKQWLRNLV